MSVSESRTDCEEVFGKLNRNFCLMNITTGNFGAFQRNYDPKDFEGEDGFDLYMTVEQNQPQFFSHILDTNPKYAEKTFETMRLPITTILVHNNLACLEILLKKDIPKNILVQVLEKYEEKFTKTGVDFCSLYRNKAYKRLKQYIE